MNKETLAYNIKKRCKQKGYSLSYMESSLSMSPGLISRWAKGTSSPSLEKVYEIAKFLDTSVDSLIKGDLITIEADKVNVISEKAFQEANNENETNFYESSQEFNEKISLSDLLANQDWDVYDNLLNDIPVLTELMSNIKYGDIQAYVTSVEMDKLTYDENSNIAHKHAITVDFYLINYYKNHQSKSILYLCQSNIKPYKIPVSQISLQKLLFTIQEQNAEEISEIEALKLFSENNIIIA